MKICKRFLNGSLLYHYLHCKDNNGYDMLTSAWHVKIGLAMIGIEFVFYKNLCTEEEDEGN